MMWQFPKELEASALRILHHSSLSLEKIVNKIHLMQFQLGKFGKENEGARTNGTSTEARESDRHNLKTAALGSIRDWVLKVCHYYANADLPMTIASIAVYQFDNETRSSAYA